MIQTKSIAFTLQLDHLKLLEEILDEASTEGPYSREPDVVALHGVLRTALSHIEKEDRVELSTEPLPFTFCGITAMVPAGTPCVGLKNCHLTPDGYIVFGTQSPQTTEQDAAPKD